MSDLAILVPSRGRPQSVARLIGACSDLCQTDYELVFAFDEDDSTVPAVGGNRVWNVIGQRDTLAGWTNSMFHLMQAKGPPRYYASIGDDHVPLTRGWDARLCEVLDASGGGFSYCDNGHQMWGQRNLPEMCVMSAEIPAALGWICEPSLSHYYVDNVWKDLGEGAGCLHYVDDVVVEHRHWSFNAAAPDGTYWDNQVHGGADRTAYEMWQAERMGDDVAKVKGALR